MSSNASTQVVSTGRGARFVIYTILLIFCLYYLLPLYVMVVNSLKPLREIQAGGMMNLPDAWTIEPWKSAWSTAQIGVAATGGSSVGSVSTTATGTVTQIARQATASATMQPSAHLPSLLGGHPGLAPLPTLRKLIATRCRSAGPSVAATERYVRARGTSARHCGK